MANVLFGVTGSVAAIKTPELFQLLKVAGHQVKVVATQSALYFFDPLAIDGQNGSRNRETLILDQDEWPDVASGRRWQRDDPVLHIELRRWADVFVLAPLDANTLAKIALGLCDNCLTCVWRAWDRSRPVVLAPAMNTLMWEHPATCRHLCQIADDLGGQPASRMPLVDLVKWINRALIPLRIAPPASKRLACDDVGVGAMAAIADIVATANAALRQWPAQGRAG
jgi:phosphopantothenoylcysteine decarboxylase